MLTSIAPLGERSRGHRWSITMVQFIAAATVGGALTGLVAGSLGHLVLDGAGDGRAWLVLVAASIAFVVDATPARQHLRWPHRQVDEGWFGRYRRWIYATGFGFQLGLGFATVVPAALIVLVAVLAVATADPLAGVAIGATFGAVRGLSLLVVGRAVDPPTLRRVMARVARLARPAEILTAATSLGVAILALTVLVR
ncbi:MAG: hypothetical protein ACXIVQ_07275 [Acidimicrobiales bacterium]